MAPDIPAAKRAGLQVDLDRLAREGDSWLTPEDRYALKMHGVCTQGQPGVFMIRTRTNGYLEAESARSLGRIADRFAGGWLHITTRQQIELHHVAASDIPVVLRRIRRAGLSNRSTCGHTMRGVLSCPHAGVGLEEPFDCLPDAKAVSDSILARTPDLDRRMPQRINIIFGGCPDCRDHARINDVGFVSTISDQGELGYELWLGGSLGKSTPTLSFRALEFVAREHVLAAANAVFDLFITHGNFDHPRKARLKFLIAGLGTDRFLELFHDAFAAARARSWPAPQPLTTPLSAPLAQIMACTPEGGWSSGIRPQRLPGWATVTVNVPLGDLDTDGWRVLAALAIEAGDERLYLTRNQNVMFRHVHIGSLPALRDRLPPGLCLEGADQSEDVRTCTGGPVCSLALTPAPRVGAQLLGHPALLRNAALRIHVSGCPNACAQHQIADIGFSGGKVTIAGSSVLGYQVWLGGNLSEARVGRVVGRTAEADVYALTGAIVGVWEALRIRNEAFTATMNRLGPEVLEAQIAAVFKGQWEPGPEPQEETTALAGIPSTRRLRMVAAG